MSARDELALELFIGDNFNQPREQSIADWEYFHAEGKFQGRVEPYKAMADGALTAGYQKTTPNAHGTTHIVKVYCVYCDGVAYQKVRLGEEIKHTCPAIEHMTVTICAWEYETAP